MSKKILFIDRDGTLIKEAAANQSAGCFFKIGILSACV